MSKHHGRVRCLGLNRCEFVISSSVWSPKIFVDRAGATGMRGSRGRRVGNHCGVCRWIGAMVVGADATGTPATPANSIMHQPAVDGRCAISSRWGRRGSRCSQLLRLEGNRSLDGIISGQLKTDMAAHRACHQKNS